MIKIVALMGIISFNAYADSSIYCPSEIICKGTAESCYVSIPKNDDGNFIFDKTHHYIEPRNYVPSGRYIYIIASFEKNEAFCRYDYADGSTDPHAATQIYYENKIRMKPLVSGSNSWRNNLNNFSCTVGHDPKKCPFEIKAL